MEAVPIYSMMMNMMLKACIEEIHKMKRNFTWGDMQEKSKYHAINWDTITKHKQDEGLGLRRLDIMNNAYIVKLVWKLHNATKELWYEVLQNKYKCSNLLVSTYRNANPSLWKIIVNTDPQALQTGSWSIGDATKTRACNGCWIE